MQRRDQRRRCRRPIPGSRNIRPCWRRRGREADGRIEDEVAELVRDHVEIERIGRMASVGKVMRPDFHEAIAGIGVVDRGPR